MDVALATSAGHPGRPNEDFVGAVPGVVVLLDGAGIPGTESICHHGVEWYTRRLGGALLSRLSRDDAPDLVSALAEAIDHVAHAHRGTCDLADPSSPQATVALTRVDGGRADYLLLADTYLALGAAGGAANVLTDGREVAVRGSCTAPLHGLAPGTPEHAVALAACIEALRARRNRTGGYWIAKDDPRAAQEAVTGSLAIDSDTHAALVSNGAARLVGDYDVMTWTGLLDRCRTEGPGRVLRMLREHEASTTARDDGSSASSDDATIASCRALV